ncbi:MAG TPA: ribbon-helix-helix protein, CopG family [Thermoanaerobaculia bacterium]|nr:ribbon-helix-helix protein, CopG family [Thermoanaerobaculia bacterium]
MARLTISLPDDLHQALKEAAARRRRSIGEVVAESLAHYGIKTSAAASELVARARERSRLDSGEAERLAVQETRRARQ